MQIVTKNGSAQLQYCANEEYAAICVASARQHPVQVGPSSGLSL